VDKLIEGLVLTPLKQIFHPQGNIYHGMKKSSPGYVGFGEAYFSTVHCGDIKGWKKHLRMTLNLVVPIGAIKFVMYDDRESSITYKSYLSVDISKDNYQRLTIPPGIWVAFKGMGMSENLLLNIASIEHDPSESEVLPLDKIYFDWG